MDKQKIDEKSMILVDFEVGRYSLRVRSSIFPSLPYFVPVMDQPSGVAEHWKPPGNAFPGPFRDTLLRVFEKNKNKNRQSSVKRHTRSRNLDRNPGSGLLPGAPPVPEAEIGAQTMTFAQLWIDLPGVHCNKRQRESNI